LIESQLVALGYCDHAQIASAKAQAYGHSAEDRRQPRIQIGAVEIASEAIESVPESVCRENNILPLAKRTDRLVIAIADQSNTDTIEKLRFILNNRIDTRLAWSEDIRRAIDHYYGARSVDASSD
jgi:hypothetical protein